MVWGCDRQPRQARIVVTGLIAVPIMVLTFGPIAASEGVDSVAADPELLAYGEYLSGECVSCHRADGMDEAIPAIAGMPADAIVAALNAYRTGARTNPAMVSAARALDDGQVEALSTYFSRLQQP